MNTSDLTPTSPVGLLEDDARTRPNLTPNALLDAVVATAHSGASPRPGQADLCRRVGAAMEAVDRDQSTEKLQVAGIAGTGTGKTFAYLAPAALYAATRGHRAVVATESLGLQRQIVDEDGPRINAGMSALGLAPVTIRLLKGFSNYIDPRTTVLTAASIIEAIRNRMSPADLKQRRGKSASLDMQLDACVDGIEDAAKPLIHPATMQAEDGSSTSVQLADDELTEIMEAVLEAFWRAITALPALPSTIEVDRQVFESGLLVDALRWAISDGVIGALRETRTSVTDRDDYEGRVEDGMWRLFTIQRSDFPTDSPVAEVCPAQIARQQAAEAHIIITNHAFLSIQAAKDVPTVLSNQTIGHIHHLVVDEAHNLPGQVRSQASGQLSGRAIRNLIRSAERLAPAEQSVVAAQVYSRGADLATRIDDTLRKACRNPNSPGEKPVKEGDNPLEGIDEELDEWLSHMRRIMQTRAREVTRQVKAKKDDRKTSSKLQEIDKCRAHHARSVEMQRLIGQCTTQRVGHARWIEYRADRPGTHLEFYLCASAVDVRHLLRSRLYTGYHPATTEQLMEARQQKSTADGEDWMSSDTSARPTAPEADTAEGDEASAVDDDTNMALPPSWRLGDDYDRSVICVSATLGSTFTREAGLDVDTSHFPSSFHDAYAESAAYLPRVLPDHPDYIHPDLLTNDWGKLDLSKHLAWSKEAITSLVTASGGRALILCTTARNGKEIAAHLRTSLPSTITVHDQWSGQGKSVLARRFADEETSVMVATRGWMTGINVPGSTCSLIIIDRVPRNPPSAVGDARAGQLVPDGKPGFHEFDQVYGSDAAVLLEQAVGRGIRAESDRVMVAVLDPRIHAGSTLSTRSSASRKMYVDVMAPFGTKTGSLDVACRWLADLRAEQADEVG